MIECYTGLPGMGKTYHMTKDALAVIRKNDKLKRQGKPYRRVFANYHVRGAEYFKELSELKDERNILILLDEASIYMPAQAWKLIPFEFIRQMRQSRHSGIDLWYTSQSFNDVPTFLRRLTQFENKCRRMWKIFTVDCICPHDKSQKYGRRFSILDENVFSCYDTHENIDFSNAISIG